MSTVEVLKAARVKISDRKHWLRKALATDERGRDVFPQSPRACNFCAIGALFAAADGCGGWLEAERVMQDLIGGGHLDTYNDSHTHKQVLALFDKAIAQLEAA